MEGFVTLPVVTAEKRGRWIAKQHLCDLHESVLVPENHVLFQINTTLPGDSSEQVRAKLQVCRKCGSLFCIQFNDEHVAEFLEETREASNG